MNKESLNRRAFCIGMCIGGIGLFLASSGETVGIIEKIFKPVRADEPGELDIAGYLPLAMKGYPPPPPIKGLNYSPYRDGQNPNWGPYPTESDIKGDVGVLGQIVSYIRTYGSDHGLENIPRFIREKGADIKVNAGCWLGPDSGVNNTLINNLINEANQNSNVISVTVGNETQQFGIMPEEQLINYINQVRQQIRQGVMITTGETWSVWAQSPNLVAAVDCIYAHIYPYWEGQPIESAVAFIEENSNLLKSLYPGKKIVIGETGWPSAGDTNGGAVPSLENQRRFINEFLAWATRERVDFYLFEFADEAWKKGNEGEVGGHWGVCYSDRTLKDPDFTLK